MDLDSCRRMLKANQMDTDNKSHRVCQRWNYKRRSILKRCASMPDGTAFKAAKLTGMSVSACRKEAKKLGVELAPATRSK